MSPLRLTLLLACAAAIAAAAAAPGDAAQVKRPPVTVQRTEVNYTPARRTHKHVKYIVVHVTEGSFWGSVEWLQNPEAKGSAHYVISRGGAIVQLVKDRDVAWHAGNKRVNELSIGIEHTGITGDPAGFTTAQYRQSARLAAYIARRALMPITRKTFIGHDQVPNPFDPAASGGADAHTDPGPYWNWARYLRLVRAYAYPKPPVKLVVGSATIYPGQTLRGRVPWRARTAGPIRRVEFAVNGKVLWRDSKAPFAFARKRGLDTLSLRNGRHVLELRAYGPKGAWTRKRIAIRVANLPFELTTAGLRPGATVSGRVALRAAVRKAPAASVALFVDGKRVALDRTPPYRFAWDARRAKPGPHVLVLKATAKDGRVSTRKLPVVVSRPGAAPSPPPPPTTPGIPPPVILGQSLEEGQVVSGVVDWRPRLTGRVVRAEFLVDGELRHATPAPFAYAWDTATVEPGERRLTLRLIGPTGQASEASLAVVVAR